MLRRRWVVEPGRASWTLPLDAVRLGPADDATEVTAAQVREVIGRLAAAGRWREGDPDVIDGTEQSAEAGFVVLGLLIDRLDDRSAVSFLPPG